MASTQRFQFGTFEGIEHSKEYTLLIQVTDEFGKDKHQQLSSTVTVVIHVVPWTTTQPTTTTTTQVIPVPSTPVEVTCSSGIVGGYCGVTGVMQGGHVEHHRNPAPVTVSQGHCAG